MNFHNNSAERKSQESGRKKFHNFYYRFEIQKRSFRINLRGNGAESECDERMNNFRKTQLDWM